jgi:hypothetical protein
VEKQAEKHAKLKADAAAAGITPEDLVASLAAMLAELEMSA